MNITNTIYLTEKNDKFQMSILACDSESLLTKLCTTS